MSTRLVGPGVRAVHVAGELYLEHQIVFRAVATGARLVMHTDRPHAWRSLVASIAAPDRLRIAGTSSPSVGDVDAESGPVPVRRVPVGTTPSSTRNGRSTRDTVAI